MGTKAFVSKDGEVVKSYIDQFAVKDKDTQQLPPDKFQGNYTENNLIEPLYNLESLAQLLEINPFHYRAVKTKARDVAGLGWKLEPSEDIEDPNQASEEQKELAMELLKRPNDDEHLSEVNDKVMVDLEATGNGYHEVVKNEDGVVTGLNHIPSHTIRRHADLNRYVQQRGNKKVWFKKYGYEYDVDKNTGNIKEEGELEHEQKANEILHIQNYTSRDDYYGIPDIVPAIGSILGDKKAKEYNIKYFENHAVPAYAVTVTGSELDEETERQIKKFFQQDVQDVQQSTLVITAAKDEGDDSAEPIEINFEKLENDNEDSSFQQYRQDNRDEILSVHGVPPYRAGITIEGQLGGSSAGESTEIYKQSVIKPRQEMLENQINRHILQEGLEITDWVFRFEEIDTRDEDKEVERMKKLQDMAAYSPNGILEYFGLEPSDDPNMNEHFLQGKSLEQLMKSEEGGGMDSMFNSVKALHEDLAEVARKDSKKRRRFK